MNLTRKFILLELTTTDKAKDLLDKIAGRVYTLDGVEGDVTATELTDEQVRVLMEET